MTIEFGAQVMPAYYDVQGAATRLNVHPALIYREIRAGRLRAVRIGRKTLRISVAALDAYIAAQTTRVTECS